MPKLFLGSNLLKRGVSWRGFKGSVIFALGFYAHGVVFPTGRVIKEIKQSAAEVGSLVEEYNTERAELIEKKKVLEDIRQLYMTRLAEVNGLGNRDVNRRKNLTGVSYEDTDQKR